MAVASRKTPSPGRAEQKIDQACLSLVWRALRAATVLGMKSVPIRLGGDYRDRENDGWQSVCRL